MKKKLSMTAAFLTAMMLISKCLGLLRDSLLAYKFGTSNIVDAYTISLTFSSIAFSLFTTGFSESYISVYARTPNERKNRFFNNTITIILFGSCIIALIGFIFGDRIVYVMAPGFDTETHSITSMFLRIMCFVIPFQAVFAILSSNEMVKENFVFPRFCDFIIINIIVIFTIFVADFDRAYVLPSGYVIANIAAVAALAIYSKMKKHISYKFILDLKDRDFDTLLVLAIPLGLSFVINDLNTMTDGMFASTVGVGMTSALNYANKIQALFLTVTVNIISVVCFPRVVAHFASGEKENALYYLRKSLMIAVYIAIPFMAFLFFYSSVVVKILFQRGNFTDESAMITSTCLTFYCAGIPFYAMSNVESQALAANTKQKTIMCVTAVSVLLNIILDYVLLKIIGYIGLPIATCCAGCFQFLLMMFALKKNEIKIIRRDEILDMIKIVVSICAASLIPIFFRVFLKSNIGIIGNMIIACCSLAAYILIGYFLNIKIEKWLISSFFHRKLLF